MKFSENTLVADPCAFVMVTANKGVWVPGVVTVKVKAGRAYAAPDKVAVPLTWFTVTPLKPAHCQLTVGTLNPLSALMLNEGTGAWFPVPIWMQIVPLGRLRSMSPMLKKSVVGVEPAAGTA